MRVYVDVDVDEVLDELSDDELREALEDRGLSSAVGGGKLAGVYTTKDAQDLEDAARAGDAFECLTILQSCMGINRLHSPEDFAKLPRDPETGRPVIQ